MDFSRVDLSPVEMAEFEKIASFTETLVPFKPDLVNGIVKCHLGRIANETGAFESVEAAFESMAQAAIDAQQELAARDFLHPGRTEFVIRGSGIAFLPGYVDENDMENTEAVKPFVMSKNHKLRGIYEGVVVASPQVVSAEKEGVSPLSVLRSVAVFFDFAKVAVEEHGSRDPAFDFTDRAVVDINSPKLKMSTYHRRR